MQLSRYISVFTFVFIFIFSMGRCKETTKSETAREPYLSPLPKQELMRLLKNADATDFIFHNLPFSVSQSDRPSVQNTISGFGLDPIYKNDCPSLGRLFVQVKGEIVIEAEIFYVPGECNYYVYYKDGKALYAGNIKNNAISFYNDLLKSAENRSQ